MLVSQYIEDFVKGLNLGQYQVVMLNKPVVTKPNLYGSPHSLVGIHADGRYIFDPELKPQTGIPQFSLSIIDVLESLERRQYNVY
jgi:hypothetical protein